MLVFFLTFRQTFFYDNSIDLSYDSINYYPLFWVDKKPFYPHSVVLSTFCRIFNRWDFVLQCWSNRFWTRFPANVLLHNTHANSNGFTTACVFRLWPLELAIWLFKFSMHLNVLEHRSHRGVGGAVYSNPFEIRKFLWWSSVSKCLSLLFTVSNRMLQIEQRFIHNGVRELSFIASWTSGPIFRA